MQPIDFDTLLAVFALIGYFVTFATFYRNQKKEHEESVKEFQKVKDTLEEHGRLIESHNHYAEMFRSCTKDISEVKEAVAFIKGQLENK